MFEIMRINRIIYEKRHPRTSNTMAVY